MTDVVVTGIGLASPFGFGREKSWRAAASGRSAVQTDKSGQFLSGRLNELDAPYQARLLSMGFYAAAEAFEDSRLDYSYYNRERVGFCVSSSKPNIFLDGSGLFLPDIALEDNLTGQLARIFKAGGPVRNVVAACATGTNSIITAARWIKSGLCDAAFAGAVESPFNDLYIAGFSRMGVLAKKVAAPFSAEREGFALAEGAGVLVLERKDTAMLRGADIYGEVAGWDMACDARNTVSSDVSGGVISDAILRALKASGIKKIDYINAHGTGTKLNDLAETNAIIKALGKDAADTPVSSTKAATGHLLGASGTVEAAFCLLSMRDSIIPPTLNLLRRDKLCGLDYVANTPRETEVNASVSLSFGFGGQIGVLVFKK